jgi:hypothetical protein
MEGAISNSQVHQGLWLGGVQRRWINSSLSLQKFESLTIDSFEMTGWFLRNLVSSPGLLWGTETGCPVGRVQFVFSTIPANWSKPLGISQPGLSLTWTEGILQTQRSSALPARGCWDTTRSRTVAGRDWKGVLAAPANVIGGCRILWSSLMNPLK